MKSVKKYINKFLSGIIFFCMFFAEVSAGNVSRINLSMNTDWAFFRGDIENGESITADDSCWMPVSIPHIMQLERKHCGGDVIYDGIGWYRRYFTLDPEYRDKNIRIAFEGVMTSCKVYLNGYEITENHGGYIGFIADITGKVNFDGNNVLAVRVSAEYDPLTPPGKPQSDLDFYYYSGIYRDVEMIISDKLYVTDPLEENEIAGGGVFVTYPEVSREKAKIHIKTHVRNRYNIPRKGYLLTRLIDSDNKEIVCQRHLFSLKAGASIHLEQDLSVDNPSLWYPYCPCLYELRTEVIVDDKTVDKVTRQIGIRSIQYTTEDGFLINGEKLYMRGANRHQAYPYVGDAASNSIQEREVINMKQGGYNAVRAAHYPHDPAFLDACDKYGLLVVECIPGWQYFNNDTTFINRVYEVCRRMIRRDRNHTSVVLWETALNETRYPKEIAKILYGIAHEEYPGDQMYTAGDYFGHTDLVDCYDVFYKQVARFPKDGNVMSNYTEDQVVIKPLLTREWGDGAGEKPRVSITENGRELLEQCNTRYEQLEGRGYFDWCMLDANERLGGHFLWSYNDYNRGSQETTMYCGVVDINRAPKFSYYMMQSMRDKNISQAGLYEGPMVFIASYNMPSETGGALSPITVFSNCDEVKLYQNKRLIGTQTRLERTSFRPNIVKKGGSPDFVFYPDRYEQGELMAEGLSAGKIVATHVVRTPGKPHHLEVFFNHKNVMPVADGSDMIPVYIKVCDENGTLVNNAADLITLSIRGQGEIIGDGIERVGISRQRVEGGIGFVFVRTGKYPGEIIVKAEAKDLQEGIAGIKSIPYDGLFVPDGIHASFKGKEEDGVVEKMNIKERMLLNLPVIIPREVTATSSHVSYPVVNLVDGDDRSWWIADTDSLPQVVTFSFDEPVDIKASRILFQKDSSLYGHTVEVSSDGNNWSLVYEQECTGWEFKPIELNCRKVKCFRVTIHSVSEGRAGMGEVTLFGKRNAD